MTNTPSTVTESGKLAITREDVMRTLAQRILEIPEPEEGDDTAILTALADAETWDDINAPWSSEGMLPYIGHEIIIRGARRFPSDFDGGTGWFLALDIVDTDTGEPKVVITGATAIVAQVAAVAHNGGFPCRCTPTEAKRAKPGRNPAQHLADVRPA